MSRRRRLSLRENVLLLGALHGEAARNRVVFAFCSIDRKCVSLSEWVSLFWSPNENGGCVEPLSLQNSLWLLLYADHSSNGHSSSLLRLYSDNKERLRVETGHSILPCSKTSTFLPQRQDCLSGPYPAFPTFLRSPECDRRSETISRSRETGHPARANRVDVRNLRSLAHLWCAYLETGGGIPPGDVGVFSRLCSCIVMVDKTEN